MSYINKTDILFKKSNCNICKISCNDNLILTTLNNNLDKISSIKLLDGMFAFVDMYFDININDEIYGIVNNKKGKLIEFNINDDIVYKDTLLKYDYTKFQIKFPYIKHLLDASHCVYLLINKYIYHSYTLIHLYIKDGVRIKSTIDFIDNNVINNFIITWNNNIPSIFYFNLVNGYEELFVSTFSYDTLSWSIPIQITHSQTQKIYLSVIRCINNSYHIAFSEKFNSIYCCRHISGCFDNNKFNIINYNLLHTDVMCLFPHIIETPSILYAQWVEYYDLYTSKSTDSGKTWTNPVLQEIPYNLDFTRYIFQSNTIKYSKINISTAFCDTTSLEILGI